MSYSTKSISGALLGKAIKSIASRSKTLDTDTQAVLLQCLLQIKEHRNMDYATKAINAMGRSQRSNAAITYLQSMAPCIKATIKGKTFQSFGKSELWVKGDLSVDMVAAEQVDFWNFSSEKPAMVITLASLEKRLASLVKAASDNLTDAEMTSFVSQLHVVKVIDADPEAIAA